MSDEDKIRADAARAFATRPDFALMMQQALEDDPTLRRSPELYSVVSGSTRGGAGVTLVVVICQQCGCRAGTVEAREPDGRLIAVTNGRRYLNATRQDCRKCGRLAVDLGEVDTKAEQARAGGHAVTLRAKPIAHR